MSEDLKSEMATLTGARQTMSAWSKVIETYETIPDVYRGFFQAHVQTDRELPYLVLTPPLDKFLRKTTEKLIYEAKAAIQILERTGNQVKLKSYPYQNIRMVEVGNVLLNSWIIIRGVTSEGVASSTTIEYNAASERYLAVFLNKMRPVPLDTDDASFMAEKTKFDYLSELNFKFMNYGRSSLVRGENVIQTILQPEIREPAWTLFGWTFYRIVSLAHLIILTDKELILIRDDERGKEVRGTRYGGVWQYIPLRSILSVSLTEPSDDRLTLVISISSNETLQKIFAVSSQPELEQLRDKIPSLIV